MPETYTCNHCGHSWQPRIDRLPVRCPKCQSTRWNTRQDNGPTVEQELLAACKAARRVVCEVLQFCPTCVKQHVLREALLQANDTLRVAVARAEKEG